ncbi:hypothetical protein E2C01_100105 [Portunus trituberculatus]|uniref:Uncharacterized protein n=1 Tax=Portunus trituberculatus TaxID=210409 RepID=A0A5B7KH41_PORTR|nr:hypothetical protein [Portunus trituberculatus]
MPKGKDWNIFLQSGDNKTELIKFLANHYKSDSFRSKLDIPLVFTESNNTWMITSQEVLLEQCNHHEADTRVVRHASLSERPVVVVATDTDIFALHIYAFSKVAPAEKWYMKINKESYVDIGDFCRTYGKEVCDVMPAYHSMTGCDTTSYKYKVGKVKPFKKMVAHLMSFLPSMSLKHSKNAEFPFFICFPQSCRLAMKALMVSVCTITLLLCPRNFLFSSFRVSKISAR